MAVEFTLEFNVETSNRGDYRDFIQNLRRRLGERSSHNRPALAVQQNPPTRFFDLALRTNDHAGRFRFRMDNLYLLGYQMENGQWLEFDNRNQNDELVHLITEPGTNFLSFDGSYGGLGRVAHQRIEEVRAGVHGLIFAINQLAVTTSWETRARSLVVVIMMISEAARLIPVYNHMTDSFSNRRNTNRDTESQIEVWIMNLVRSWYALSGALLRADAYPEERFQLRANNIQIPNGRQIRTIADAVEILGILLGLCFHPRGPKRVQRMTFDDGGQCFSGLPLVQVFSVQINNIDDEDPGQLYGSIVVDDGLYTQYIYNRNRGDYESIKPGQNATLIGPSQSVCALGNVTIKLLLTDKDIISWFDDVIVDQAISWDSANIGNVYDKLISHKLDSSRGSVTVNYAVLENAVAARVTVTIEEGGEATTQTYGHVSACYDKWEDPKTCLLFDRTSENCVDVRRWQTIPLLRSVVAVPLNNSLNVTARLYDYDYISADQIANGTVEIPVPGTIPFTTFNRIDGEDGNWVTVTVYWTSGF